MIRLVFAPIPKFDDGFARHKRYGPPSDFRLTSTYSGIVHHLSSPSICALTQICLCPFLSDLLDRSMVLIFTSFHFFCYKNKIHFHSAFESSPSNTCAYARLLGPCSKTGPLNFSCLYPLISEFLNGLYAINFSFLTPYTITVSKNID